MLGFSAGVGGSVPDLEHEHIGANIQDALETSFTFEALEKHNPCAFGVNLYLSHNCILVLKSPLKLPNNLDLLLASSA